mmetsp:Transcript_25153/g.71066  ORF Transcript_25153/g.71066 Transcript_25153/m.71066 type:complete len:787 (-) Transcript_25153:144-2504(-)
MADTRPRPPRCGSSSASAPQTRAAARRRRRRRRRSSVSGASGRMGNSGSVAKSAPRNAPEQYSKYPGEGTHWHTDKKAVLKVRYAESGVAAREEDGGAPSGTLVRALKNAVERRGDMPALAVERPTPDFDGKSAPESLPRDQWMTWTYREYYNDVRRAAKGFIELGAVRYDGISVLGFNAPEWHMSILSAMHMGAIVAGIYGTDTAEQVAYKAGLTDSSIAVVDNKDAFDRFAQTKDDIPYLKAIVCWEYTEGKDLTRSDGSVIKVLTWKQLLEIGDEGDDDKLDELYDSVQPGSVGGFIFTSGTTGNPKAVMLSHDSFVFLSYIVLTTGCMPFGTKDEQDRLISYLPLSHVAGMMMDVVSPIICTAYMEGYCTVYFARPYDLKVGTFGARLKAVRPTLFFGVPRVWEKIAEKLKAVGAQSTGAKKALSTWAKSYGTYAQTNSLLGGNGARGLAYPIANVLLGKIKEALGLNETKFMFSGAAPITRETLEYFASLGVNINEAYGMSETTGAVTWSTNACHQWGSIGYELAGTEVRVMDSKNNVVPDADNFDQPAESQQGEICFRGRQIMMGYLANPKFGEEHMEEMRKKNAETIDENGFLHSGDKGSRSALGMFRITGRYKELIITAGGENIAPVPIENAVKKFCPAVSNIMMVGDKRKFNCALITLKAVGASGERPGGEELDGDAKNLVPGVTTIPQACESAEYIKLVTDAIVKANKDGSVCPSNACKIQKFTILPMDFSVETGELTPSLKLKRSVATDKYANIIEAIYKSKETFVPYSSAPITE